MYTAWILLQITPPQTRIEWLFLVLTAALTVVTLGLKTITEYFKRNRPVDDTHAANECKELKNRMDVFQERFNLVDDRLSRVESRGMENRRLIRKLINRVLNKSL